MRRSVDNFLSVTAYYRCAILRKVTFWREHPFQQVTLQFTCGPQLFKRWIRWIQPRDKITIHQITQLVSQPLIHWIVIYPKESGCPIFEQLGHDLTCIVPFRANQVDPHKHGTYQRPRTTHRMLEMWVLQAPCCHLSHGARQQSEMAADHCGQPPVMKTTYRLIDCNKTIINLYPLNILPAPKIKVGKNHSKFWIRRKLAKRKTEKNNVFVQKKKFFLFCERSHHRET